MSLRRATNAEMSDLKEQKQQHGDGFFADKKLLYVYR